MRVEPLDYDCLAAFSAFSTAACMSPAGPLGSASLRASKASKNASGSLQSVLLSSLLMTFFIRIFKSCAAPQHNVSGSLNRQESGQTPMPNGVVLCRNWSDKNPSGRSPVRRTVPPHPIVTPAHHPCCGSFFRLRSRFPIGLAVIAVHNDLLDFLLFPAKPGRTAFLRARPLRDCAMLRSRHQTRYGRFDLG